MSNWFTVEEIDTDTFAISEYLHWERPHCYLLCGEQSALLIDTGLGIGNIADIVKSLTEKPVLAAATHAHWDHIGGFAGFENIAVHEKEADWLSGHFPLPLSAVKDNLTRRPCPFPAEFDINRYQIFQGKPQRLLHDEDLIRLGGRDITVLHTPGHSPGHCCFYEAERSTLYSGDLIYKGCLDAFYPSTDPQLFRNSVQRLQSLRLSQIYPGHYLMPIRPEFLHRVGDAFDLLWKEGILKHGSGVFDFDDFQVHL